MPFPQQSQAESSIRLNLPATSPSTPLWPSHGPRQPVLPLQHRTSSHDSAWLQLLGARATMGRLWLATYTSPKCHVGHTTWSNSMEKCKATRAGEAVVDPPLGLDAPTGLRYKIPCRRPGCIPVEHVLSHTHIQVIRLLSFAIFISTFSTLTHPLTGTTSSDPPASTGCSFSSGLFDRFPPRLLPSLSTNFRKYTGQAFISD